jgi:ABC-2 type transport system permease protein
LKVLDVALKDMLQSSRSYFALVFMFGIPILITGLFFFMFGGLRDEEEGGFTLPVTSVLIVNLDQEGFETLSGFGDFVPGEFGGDDLDLGGESSMGEIVPQIMGNEDLAEFLEVSIGKDPNNARQAVDNQEFDVAIIIPENFTQAMLIPEERATIELYQDPTLTIGPAIVGSILNQMVEGFSGTKIGMGVAIDQLNESGIIVDNQLAGAIAMQFIQSSGGNGASEYPGSDSFLEVIAPQAGESAPENTFIRIIGMIMAGIMIFFAFFTGAASAQSILTEEEKGTLPRLFTTPTAELSILTGKFLAVALTVLVQISFLILFARFVFGITWGEPLTILIFILATVLITSTCGIFIISFLSNSRQAGIVFGGVLTLTGMVGIFSVFTVGVSNPPPMLDTIALFVPQGWTMRALRLSMSAGQIRDFSLMIGGMLLWSAVFFTIGFFRFKKRYT